jgi:hypothetical protein
MNQATQTKVHTQTRNAEKESKMIHLELHALLALHEPFQRQKSFEILARRAWPMNVVGPE